MDSKGLHRPTRRTLRLGAILASGMLVLTVAGSALAGLVSGSLPGSAFAFTSSTINDVNIDGIGIHLKVKGSANVKTTYARVAPTGSLLGWHYHIGPVIVTVAVGTLSFLDATCNQFDLGPGQSFIESTGQVLNAYADPAKNAGIGTVEWFTTRLYPAAATTDQVAVSAPC